MTNAEQQYQQTFETYLQRFFEIDGDDDLETALTVVGDLEPELRRAQQDTFLLAFGFCLYSINGPTQYWDSHIDSADSASPEDVAIALAQSAMVNDILNES